MKYQIITVHISGGNVQQIARHNVTTPRGAARLKPENGQIWMTEETARALGVDVQTFWGTLPDGTEIQIKTTSVMETA